MRVPYTWLLDYLKTDVGAEELAKVLTMGGLEVEEVQDWTSEDGEAKDQVLLTKITANRGDLLSMVGVARQAAALLGCEWRRARGDEASPCTPLWGGEGSAATVTAAEYEPASYRAADVVVGAPVVQVGDVTVEIADLVGCPRYSALVIRGVKVGPSPAWLRHRLEAAGVRPISNVVDATNYVCWELGQPMHAFDLRLVARNHIIVRRAAAGETIKLIDQSTLQLDPRDLMICDKMGTVALAGVMGGLETEVGERTTAVLLESAHFDPVTVRRGAQRHGLSTEASYRFERYVDPNGTIPALERAAGLILATAGGTADPVILDVRERCFEPRQVSLRPERCNALLGTDIAAEQMAQYLERLGMEVLQREPVIQVRVPTFRPDVEREVDLIEEVAIVHGYNNIPMTVPGKLRESGLLNARQRAERRARQLLRQAGLNETISFSFMSEADLDRCRFPASAPERRALKLLMPISPEMSHLRTTLIPGLLAACRDNVRQRVLDVALYDIDRVFLPRGEGELPHERMRVAGVLMGKPFTSDWNLPQEVRAADFYWLKGIVEQLCDGLNVPDVSFRRGAHPTFHPGRCAELLVRGEPVGVLGEVAPEVQEGYDLPSKVYLFEADLEALLAEATTHRKYDPLPRFPAALRDIALVMPDDEEHSAAAVEAAIRTVGGDLLWKVEAFDLFVSPERLGQGRKSLAFRLTFRAPDRTLTDEELDAAVRRIAEHLQETLSAELRDQ